MSTLSLRLPDSIHRHIKEIAEREGVSINQLISTAVTEKVSALLTDDYIQERAARADNKNFQKILKKVPAREPMQGDELQ
jgi:predicted DNA-binding ribbon-helix-helix protein